MILWPFSVKFWIRHIKNFVQEIVPTISIWDLVNTEALIIIRQEKMLKSKWENVGTRLKFVLIERAKLPTFPRNASRMAPWNIHTIPFNIAFWIILKILLVQKIWSFKHKVSERCPWTFRSTCFYFLLNNAPVDQNYDNLICHHFVCWWQNSWKIKKKSIFLQFFFQKEAERNEPWDSHFKPAPR